MTTIAQDAPRGNKRRKDSNHEPLIIAEWPINVRGEIARVSIEAYRGVSLINIRISLGVKNLPHLAEALNKALALAREQSLIETSPDESKGASGESHVKHSAGSPS